MKIRPDGPDAAYEQLMEIGSGAMGVVHRARDHRLRRDVAVKLLRTEYAADPSLLARFIEEAQTTARLEHPGIVPVHALGKLDDGRPYFAMKEIKGKTLTTLIAEVHASCRDGRWLASPSGWTLHRLVQAFLRVCEAVSFAHSRGVVHRDIKPDNIMLGAFGEVLVLDWGLAVLAGQDDVDPADPDAPIPPEGRGWVVGTPCYMPPEQARAEKTSFTADVYALGAVLYEILSGEPPYDGPDAETVLQAVRSGPPPQLPRARRFITPLGQQKPLPPADLVDLCDRAMMRSPSERFPEAGEFGRGIQAFLDGARDHERALLLVTDSDAMEPRADDLAARAKRLRLQAGQLQRQIPGDSPVDEKRKFWDMEDEAEELEQQAALEAVQRIQTLRAALSLDPELPEAHARLAEHYRLRMSEAEASGDLLSLRRAERHFRAHDDGRHAVWLRGDGALTLLTEPSGAAVEIYRCVERDRRIALQTIRHPGRAPLHGWHLPMGSYLVVIKKEGYANTRYPVYISRQGHWDGIPPGETQPRPVELLRPSELGVDDCYVPAGWFTSGGDAEATGGLPRREVWLEAFVISRFPVTHRQWLDFLNALLAAGKEGDALRFVPRDRPPQAGAPARLLYARGPDNTYRLPNDVTARGGLDMPVTLIDWHGASAFAAFEAARTGLAWRLPWEFEREKASRGVDGRVFPWGEHLDPTFANTSESFRTGPAPSVIDSFPIDESPYGVRGVAGNVRDWCLDVFRQEGPNVVDGRFVPYTEGGSTRSLRGGAFTAYRRSASAAFRLGDSPEGRAKHIGLRLCRTVR